MALGEKIFALVTKIGFFGDIVMPLYLIFTLLILIIVFVLISALYIITVCEFHIVANIGVLLIGLGGSRIFKDYAINVMRYILSVALKLFVLQIIMNIGFQIITVESIQNADFTAKASQLIFIMVQSLMVQSLLLLALAKCLPDTCAGILSGSTINSGNPLLSVARSAATMATGAAGYAAGAAGAAKMGASAVGAVRNSYSMAKAGGASGVMGYAKGMGQAVLEARGAAKTAEINSSPGNMRNQLQSLGSMAREQMKLMKSGGSETAPAPMSATVAPETVGGDTGSSNSETGSSSSPAGTTSVPPPPAHASSSTPTQASAPLPPSPKESATLSALKTKARTVDMRTPNLGK